MEWHGGVIVIIKKKKKCIKPNESMRFFRSRVVVVVVVSIINRNSNPQLDDNILIGILIFPVLVYGAETRTLTETSRRIVIETINVAAYRRNLIPRGQIGYPICRYFQCRLKEWARCTQAQGPGILSVLHLQNT